MAEALNMSAISLLTCLCRRAARLGVQDGQWSLTKVDNGHSTKWTMVIEQGGQ